MHRTAALGRPSDAGREVARRRHPSISDRNGGLSICCLRCRTVAAVIVTVGRSPLRVLAHVVLAVPAILLAVDMTISHRLFPEPETRDVVTGQTINSGGEEVDVTEQILTNGGRAERRRDLFFGIALGIAGVVTLAWGIKEVAGPTRYLVADGEGFRVRIAGARRPLTPFTWDQVDAVRSTVVEEEGTNAEVLSFRFVDAEAFPVGAAGAIVDPPWLHVYAEGWEIPAHRVAPVLDAQAARVAPEPEPSIE